MIAPRPLAGPLAGSLARPLTWVAAAGAVLCLALLAARTATVISFTEPLQVFTSGDEQSSLLALWRFVHGLDIYTDRHAVPFANIGYNWLYYQAYGAVAGVLQTIFDLDDAWLPSLGRWFTLVGAAVGGVAAYAAFRHLARGADGLLPAALAVFVAVGPVVGFWAITVRPDLWAAVWEVVGAALFLHLYPGRRGPAIIAAVACAYLAWAFKQSNIFLAGGVGLFLLARRDWAALAGLVGGLAVLWAATLFFGPEQYRQNILFTDFPLAFTIGRLGRNLGNFAVKSGPSLFTAIVFIATVAASGDIRRALWRDDAALFATAGCLAAALSIPASAQTGASESYYFSLSFFLALFALAGMKILTATGSRAATAAGLAMVAGWTTLAAALVLVLGGVTGVIDMRPQHARHMELKRCLDAVPRPLYVHDRYLSLPWMTPDNTPYVLAYIYETDRALGASFEHGGIGGMISSADFAAVVVRGDSAPGELDGARLDGYRQVPTACRNFIVLARQPAAGD